MKTAKEAISERAVLVRINRKLAQQGQKLCKSRGWRQRQDRGDYYLIDTSTNAIVGSRLTLITQANALRVFDPNHYVGDKLPGTQSTFALQPVPRVTIDSRVLKYL